MTYANEKVRKFFVLALYHAFVTGRVRFASHAIREAVWWSEYAMKVKPPVSSKRQEKP